MLQLTKTILHREIDEDIDQRGESRVQRFRFVGHGVLSPSEFSLPVDVGVLRAAILLPWTMCANIEKELPALRQWTLAQANVEVALRVQ